MRLEPIAAHCVVHFSSEEHFDFAEIIDEDKTFRHMRDVYLARHIRFNGYKAVLEVCSQGFGIPVDVLQGRQRGSGVGIARSKLIAFSRVVSAKQPYVNTLVGIGRIFHRSHPSVLYCINRYGAQITTALEKSA